MGGGYRDPLLVGCLLQGPLKHRLSVPLLDLLSPVGRGRLVLLQQLCKVLWQARVDAVVRAVAEGAKGKPARDALGQGLALSVADGRVAAHDPWAHDDVAHLVEGLLQQQLLKALVDLGVDELLDLVGQGGTALGLWAEQVLDGAL